MADECFIHGGISKPDFTTATMLSSKAGSLLSQQALHKDMSNTPQRSLQCSEVCCPVTAFTNYTLQAYLPETDHDAAKA